MAHCSVLGIPLHEGTGRFGCDMGPGAFRAAGLSEALSELGHQVDDLGLVVPLAPEPVTHDNAKLKSLPAVVGWTRAITQRVAAIEPDSMPVLLGGDHAMAAGVLSGLSQRAQRAGRPLFVLWLDAHTDCHTLETTTSGNLHGVPIAYAVGEPGFDGVFPRNEAPVDPRNICMLGIRSVDPAEQRFIAKSGITVHDMRAIDEHGVVPLLSAFLERVKAAGGDLHVSLDVDFLDPSIAPGVGTTVPGGATFREAHLVMEMLHDSGLVTSLDLAELNPFLDERGRTAQLMVDLVASLMGRRVLDRPTRSFA
ncbi:MAG: arginase [Bosea sp. (in: a-proteobacteria)]